MTAGPSPVASAAVMAAGSPASPWTNEQASASVAGGLPWRPASPCAVTESKHVRLEGGVVPLGAVDADQGEAVGQLLQVQQAGEAGQQQPGGQVAPAPSTTMRRIVSDRPGRERDGGEGVTRPRLPGACHPAYAGLPASVTRPSTILTSRSA